MKIKLFFISFLLLLAPLLTADTLTNLSNDQLLDYQKNNPLVIDIRTVKEWQMTGTIPHSKKLTFFPRPGQPNLKQWLNDLEQLKTSADQAVILVCHSGNRSGKVGYLLAQQLNMKNIFHLSNGISSWIKAGNQTIKK